MEELDLLIAALNLIEAYLLDVGSLVPLVGLGFFLLTASGARLVDKSNT